MTDSEPAERSSTAIDKNILAKILNPPAAWDPILPAMIFREKVEDFEVEEIPAYLPGGVGDHLYLWVEKTDTSAAEFISRLSKQLQVPARDIGVAGQKDRRAITRQFVSVPRSCETQLADFRDDQVKILSVSAHANKLRTGHLTGNRFRIVLRTSGEEALRPGIADDVRKRMLQIHQLGFPNYFGPQRFGHDGNNLADGISLLSQPGIAKKWNPQKRRYLKKMLPSAVQSGVFNLVLADRVASSAFREPIDGDVVCSREGIRPFAWKDASKELTEFVPMGPMPGGKMLPAESTAFDLELSCMKMIHLTPEDFAASGKRMPGTRRRMVTFPTTGEVRQTNDSLELNFVLPAGSFATVLLAQLGNQITERDRWSAKTSVTR